MHTFYNIDRDWRLTISGSSRGSTMVGSSNQGSDDALLHDHLERKIPTFPTFPLDRHFKGKNHNVSDANGSGSRVI